MYLENARGEKRAMSFVGHEGGRGSGIECTCHVGGMGEREEERDPRKGEVGTRVSSCVTSSENYNMQ